MCLLSSQGMCSFQQPQVVLAPVPPQIVPFPCTVFEYSVPEDGSQISGFGLIHTCLLFAEESVICKLASVTFYPQLSAESVWLRRMPSLWQNM